jgi:hypothetical protein
MTIAFPPDLEQFVQQALDRKQYSSRYELVMDAVRLLRDSKATTNLEVCDWFQRALEQVRAIAALPPDWDGDGAPALDPKLVHAGESFLYRLWKTGFVSKPHINPTRRGGIQFEWETGNRSFEVEIIAADRGHWFYQDEAERVEEEGELTDLGRAEVVMDYVRRVQTA